MIRSSALFLLTTTAMSTMAWAETANDVSTLTEIVITAQKTSERAQDVPLVVSVVAGRGLTESGANRLQDIAATVPALQVDSITGVPGIYTLTMRGINTGRQSSNTVATYIDDVPVGSSSAFSASSLQGLDLFPYDLDHVEILEGPQGTLYGASSMGGLVKYVTHTPSLTENRYQLGGEALTIDRASDAGWSARGAADLVVIPSTLAVGISGVHQYYPGYIDNAAPTGGKNYNHGKQDGARGVLYWKPDEKLQVKVQGIYNRSDFNGNGTIGATADGNPTNGKYTIFSPTGQGSESTTKLGSANIDYDFGPVKLTSVTSYSDASSIILFDASGSFNPIFGFDANFGSDYNTKKFTQELRIASPLNDRFHWLFGAYYTEENVRFKQLGTAYAPGTSTVITAVDPLLTGLIVNRFEEVAVFGNATFNITDQWDISGGLRYSHNSQSVTETAGGFLFGGATLDFGKSRSKDDATTFSASTSYHLTRDEMVYARIASGYRPGGPNFILPGFPPTYGPDRLTNYEVGFKSELLDRRLLLNVSAFYIDWRKIQFQAISPFGLAYNANGGRATSKGLELTTNFKVSQYFSLGAAVSYTDPKLKDDAPIIFGKAGDTLPFTAKWSTAITADSAWPINGNMDGHAGLVWRYTGSRDQQFPGAPFYVRLKSYDTLNANLGITRGAIKANLFVRNLFNGDDLTSFVQADGATPLQPRTIGLSLDVSFH